MRKGTERYQPKFPPMERRLLNQLQELRQRVHEQMRQELAGRLETNPVPTDEEILVGAFREMLEPQVRDAVFDMFRKGYTTNSSGFYWEGRVQTIDGPFTIDPATEEKIKQLGAQVRRIGDITFIDFFPDKADLLQMKQKWDAIAVVLTPLDHPAYPSRSGGAADWRKAYADPIRTEKIWKERQ